jgi:SHS2 domain-containing protein
MEERSAGFREVAHTADWGLDVWAPDLSMLLKQAALGMYSLAGISLRASSRLSRDLEIVGADAESILVAFLSELLFIAEQEGQGFDRYDLVLKGNSLLARLEGAPIIEMRKEIKAVTFHGLVILQDENGLSVRIIFDV